MLATLLFEASWDPSFLLPSPLANTDRAIPGNMPEEDVQGVIENYRNAARNAMGAVFDSVEVQGSGGYMPDQFLQDVTNK